MTMTATEAPAGVRLLAGLDALGRPATLEDHLAHYGPAPLIGAAPGTTGPAMVGPPSAGEWLIQGVEQAGLTGSGGAAFPTGREMRAVASSGHAAVVLVNAVDAEPTSGKDRLLLTAAPHLVLDGATLAAYAVGAREIVVCVGDDATTAAVDAALAERARALLTPVPVRVLRVPGGYVCGEESALVNAANGGPARPASTLPRPNESGVAGRPTLVGNSETLAHIALIARYGPRWFRSCGTPEAPGTALFTVSGSVVRPGVVEAPTGTSVGELLRMAGGPSEPVQAILTGGYGGTWLPPALLNVPATMLESVGATLGPGIVVAFPARACGLAETARVLAWLAAQSAGQCGPCLQGLPAIAGDFATIAASPTGPGTPGTPRTSADRHQALQRLTTRLSPVDGQGALHHPDGAVRFALSALRIFEGHLSAHERGCPAADHPGVLPTPPGRDDDPTAARRPDRPRGMSRARRA